MALGSSSRLEQSPPVRLPDLPFEIIRRILRHRLELSPSFPCAPDSGPARIGLDDGWDGMPGQIGRKVSTLRQKEREEVMRAAMGLMRVCKAWKPVVQRLLYASPPITAATLLPLAAAVHLGDSKWDDTRLHPHSVPGRYITTLDLSTLSDGYFGPHVTSLSKACAVLLPLLPNLQHLKLPGGTGWGIIPCSRILEAPFVGRLRALEGVQISDDPAAGEEVLRLLRPMRALVVLSILGPGSSLSVTPTSTPDPLDLPRLHTLTLDGVQHGPLLSALIASDLPALRRVMMTSYNDTPLDLTTAFLQTHGHKLVSLTFLPTREWPPIHPTPPTDVLGLCPNLRELGILLPHPALQKTLRLAEGLAGDLARRHPLELLTLPKWLDRISASPSASPAPTHQNFGSAAQGGISSFDRLSIRRDHPPPGNPFLATILADPPAALGRVRVDGFSWVSPRLGRAAQETGAGAETRVWAGYMRRRGVELVDGEGRVMPGLAEEEGEILGEGRGRRRGSKGLGMVGMLMDVGRVREVDEDADGG